MREAEPALLKCNDRDLYNATVLFLFRGINHREFSSRLTQLADSKPNMRAVTEALTANGDVMKNLKVWLFYCVKHRANEQRRQGLAKRWHIRSVDVEAFGWLRRATIAYLRELGTKYAALTLDNLDRRMVRIVDETKTWLGKFVSRKLRFVIESQALHRKDVENELVLRGLQGLLAMYPIIETHLHAVNTVKRVIHNQGINMIDHFTTQKVGRLSRDSQGMFSARVISLDEAQLNTIAVIDRNRDLEIEVRRLIDGLEGKRKTFVSLLCGLHSDDFTEWLTDAGYKIETNEELYERMAIKTYMNLVLKYLGVPLASGQRLFIKLQQQLKPYSKNPTQQVVTHWN